MFFYTDNYVNTVFIISKNGVFLFLAFIFVLIRPPFNS